ncbi:MAG: hypothetical protein ABJC26_09080 [Gemmatimonadaceae bacterium]
MYVITDSQTNSQFPQSSVTGVQTVVPTELALRQQAYLLDRQNQLAKAVVGAQAKLTELESTTPTNSARQAYVTQITSQRDLVQELRAQLAETRAQLAAMQAQTTDPVFVATTQPQPLIFGHTQEEIGLAGSFLLLFPIVLAIAVRIWKRGSSTSPAPISPDRFARLESAMESVAVEVERLGESQRFTSKLLNEAHPKQQPATVKPNYERLMRTPV